MLLCLSEAMADRLGPQIIERWPDTDTVCLRRDGTFTGPHDDIEVFCFSVDLADDDRSLGAAVRLLETPTLRWVQAPGAGVELAMWSDLMARGVRLTSAAGIHAEPIAQYVFTYVLHWERQVVRHQRQQAERVWQAIHSDDLSAKTIGIVGMGGIGAATARVAKAFGMRVLALRRSEIDDPDVDVAYGPDGLHDLLGSSHYVVLSLPLSDATRHLIDAASLRAMQPDAVLVNVARGGVVDQDALVGALERGDIRGATLDVADPEPLDADSPLWDLDNCVLTPHDAGYSPLAGERLGRLFLENLAGFVRGDRLVNEVDP